MSPGATFERVYLALKDRLGSARLAMGEHLEPAAWAQELNASSTPVRDALHRLVGEGLVEAPRDGGFRVPLVTEVALRHAFRWNAAVLDLAWRPHHGSPLADPVPAGDDPVEATEQLFLAIAGWSGNPEHRAAVARLNDRLRAVRRHEAGLLADAADEIAALAALADQGRSPRLRRALAAYHRRRERIVAELVALRLMPR